MSDSSFTRVSLGRRLAAALDEKAGRGEIDWHVEITDRIVYVVAWADPKPATLRMTPGEAADWVGIEVRS